MGNLYRIVDTIRAESSGIHAKLLVARVGLKVGVSLAGIDETTPNNPALEGRLIAAAGALLHKELVVDYGR